MTGYLKNISEGFSTIFEGLAITASHLLRRPITTQYPDKTALPVKEMLPANYRGFLEVDMKICTSCTLCMLACPIQCINIGITKGVPKEKTPEHQNTIMPSHQNTITPSNRLISVFDIDVGKCMFCGLCTEVCPTGAIRFTREFERATQNLDDLTFKFVKGEPVVPYKKAVGSSNL